MTPLLLLALLPLDLSGPAPVPPKRAPPAAHRHIDPRRKASIADPARRPLAIDLRASVGPIRNGAQVSVVVVHRWSGPTPERFLEGDRGACAGPQDYLLVDGAARALIEWQICDGPAVPEAEVIPPGGTWTTRGHIVLAPGRHRLRAVYRVDEKQAALLDRPDNMIVFHGEARSPEIVVDIPPH